MSRVFVWAVISYVVTLPLIGATVFVDRFTEKAVVPADILFAVVICAFALARPSRRLPLRPGVMALAGVVVAVLAFSALITGGGRAVPELVRTVYSMAVLVVFSHIRLGEDERRRIAQAWMVTAAVLALVAGLGYAAETILGLPPNTFTDAASRSLGPSIPRVASVMHANALALYLTVSVSLAAYALAARSTDARRSGCALFAVYTVVAALTFSRGFGGFVLTLTLLAAQFERLRWLWRWRRVLAVLSGVVVACVVVTLMWSVFPLERRTDSVLGIGLNTRAPAYWLLHLAGVRMVLAHPVLGVGLGEFRASFCNYTTATERSQVWPPLGCDWLPHSVWLGYAAEGGAFVLAAWIGLFAGLLAMLVRAAARARSSLAAAAFAALVGLSFDGLHIDFTHLKFVWAFLGLGIAALHTDTAGTRADPPLEQAT